MLATSSAMAEHSILSSTVEALPESMVAAISMASPWMIDKTNSRLAGRVVTPTFCFFRRSAGRHRPPDGRGEAGKPTRNSVVRRPNCSVGQPPIGAPTTVPHGAALMFSPRRMAGSCQTSRIFRSARETDEPVEAEMEPGHGGGKRPEEEPVVRPHEGQSPNRLLLLVQAGGIGRGTQRGGVRGLSRLDDALDLHVVGAGQQLAGLV